MELEKRRAIEVEMDEMRVHGDDGVQAWLNQAHSAMKNRQWSDVERCMQKAREEFTPPVWLEQEIVRVGGAQSMSQARRLLSSNAVFVDGKRPKPNSNIAGYGELTVGKKVFRPDA